MLLLPSKASNLLARRSLLTGSGRAVLSATAVGLLVGCTAKAGTMQTADTSKSDVDILNTALALEYEGIAAYQVGAESGLLQPPVLKLAVGFQSDHKQHAEALAKAITKLGGMPVQSQSVRTGTSLRERSSSSTLNTPSLMIPHPETPASRIASYNPRPVETCRARGTADRPR